MTKKSPGQAAREEWGILNHMDDRDPLLWDAIAAAAIEAACKSKDLVKRPTDYVYCVCGCLDLSLRCIQCGRKPIT